MLEYDGVRVVLDLGYSTLPQLLAYVPNGGVDGVIITHEHPDHCVDLHGLFRLRKYGHGNNNAPRLPLYCPFGVLNRLEALKPDADLLDVFDHRVLPGTYRVGPFELTTETVPHFVPTVGVKLSSDDLVLAYLTDTGPSDVLATLGRSADLLVLDATDRPDKSTAHKRNLLTAAEAGEWARRAGAKRLLLTHLWPGIDPAGAVLAAAQSFAGPIDVARQGLIVSLD